MSFDTFNSFDFNFNMLPHVDFTLYRYVQGIDDAGSTEDGYDSGTPISEPLVSSNYNNISYDSNTGGSLRTEINGWWSHVPDVPEKSKLKCANGQQFIVANKGRTDVIPGSFYYALKEVDNDD